jgi:cysteine desulfurase, sufS subfamily|nr:cysteine desulfurase [uncultured Porphyromonas sp.]
MYSLEDIRKEFPILSKEVHGKPLIYLDNAATTQKPLCVVEAINEAYYSANANVHRGVHYLSQLATEHHEEARRRVARFIGAPSPEGLIFTRGTTEAINLVAYSAGEAFFLSEGDEILISTMEHHSNIVPWQLLAARRGAKLKVIPLTPDGQLDMSAYRSLLSPRTRLVSVAHVSNVLGTVNPVEEVTRLAHEVGALVLIDGAQAVAHTRVNVEEIGADFYAFSAHKIYGPVGIGALWGRPEVLEQMPPYMGGGEMIEKVSFEKTTYNVLPFKFEAGTPDYVGSTAFAVALDFVERLGIEAIAHHEEELLAYATERLLSEFPESYILGTAPHKGGILSFGIGKIHPFDLGTLLDHMGVAIRTGHHCAEPLLHSYGYEAVARASFGLYNTREEVDYFFKALHRVVPMLL